MNDSKPEYKTAADGHIYHKSATANATEAPTNEVTKENAAKTKGLNTAQSEFVTIIDYEWHLKGNLSADAIKEEYGYEEEEYSKLQSDPQILQALKERGINAKAVAPDSEIAKEAGRSKLTPIQLIVANSMLDLIDTRPVKKKLADLNVTPYQYQSWIKDPDFKHYLQERAEGMLGDVQHEAMLALIDKVMSGDMKAIEYYHEITGRFVKQSTSNSGTAPQQDLQQMIIRIIEIIVDEVEDFDVATRISERLKGLVMGNQVAGVLAVPVIEQPEIAEARVLSAKGQDLLDRGVGVND